MIGSLASIGPWFGFPYGGVHRFGLHAYPVFLQVGETVFEPVVVVDSEHDSGLILSIEHGAAILATGNQKSPTTSYHYEDSDRIQTQSEFGKALRADEINLDKAEDIVMIQCVDSREKEAREYCSRVCCMGALQNALLIKEKKPDVRIFVLYRDMMSYGAYERYYTEARTKGVIFVPYDPAKKPDVEVKNGKPVVSFRDPILDAEIEVAANWLVLSTGIQADPANQQLVELLKDAVSHEVFIYGDKGVGDAIALFNEVNAASSEAQMEALSSGDFQNMQSYQIRNVLAVLDKQGDKLKVPTIVKGMKLSDTQRALDQLQRLETILQCTQLGPLLVAQQVVVAGARVESSGRTPRRSDSGRGSRATSAPTTWRRTAACRSSAGSSRS